VGGYERLEITSGIGARGYYRRQGFDLKAPYMTKALV
jgi:elongator complex protein 3